MNNFESSVPCRILFLEDEEQDVELMQQELDLVGFKNVSKRVSSKKEFLQVLIDFKPDIILADYLLPSFNGMHAFQLFKKQNIYIPFILVTGALSDELSLECVSEGVDDFILKENYKRLPLLIKRNLEIKKVENEKRELLKELEKKNDELSFLYEKTKKAKVHELLSNREFEILCLIAFGKSTKEIADQLFLSPATIATYRARLLEKLDLKSNVDLTRYAIENKLID
ncbi:MAG: response regulator transcription factor [Bacteroidota bacterium]